jgi:hypothetical protein
VTTLTLNRLMESIRADCPGALDDTIRRSLFSCLREMLHISDVWTNDIPLDVTVGETTYDLFPTDDGNINRLMYIFDLNQAQVYGRMPVPGTLILRDAPNVDTTYTVTVALTVFDPVTPEGYPLLPDWIIERYSDELVDGVLGRLMSQPVKPYSNQQLAVYHLRRWRNGIARARIDARQQNLFASQAWRFPRSFAGRSQRT